jgi:anti-sigma regulatory factor (Ser/Thr protein kinase)
VIVHVRDQGKGFNHRHLPDCTASDRLELPHGRGILLMCCYMDEVKFNSKGNCVTLMKRLPANPEPSC